MIFKGDSLLFNRVNDSGKLDICVKTLNPRKNEGEYTSFSFPSKILQYMSSGTPVLCYKLDGMDEKYGEYLFFVRRDETLADAIHRVYRMERTQLRSIGENARKYVEREKTSEAQTKKILVEVL